ncbi:hypothetical protein ACEU0B_000056, partial [Stenotrophomonas indicatrix]|uniref:hypothetical protein n=1 Tax=Stenotrophomonas indicatrix TaxID=2045451 RepID=UPI00372EFFE0
MSTKVDTYQEQRADQRSAPTKRSVSTKVDTYQEQRADQRSAPTNSSGNLSKAGWVRLRGCPRHGCRGQAPMDG